MFLRCVPRYGLCYAIVTTNLYVYGMKQPIVNIIKGNMVNSKVGRRIHGEVCDDAWMTNFPGFEKDQRECKVLRLCEIWNDDGYGG
jgi:hypothetical protein